MYASMCEQVSLITECMGKSQATSEEMQLGPLRPSCLNTFASSTGDFNVITLDQHEEVGEFAVVENTGHFDDDRLGRLMGLEGMKVDTVKPQEIVFVFPIGKRAPTPEPSLLHDRYLCHQ